MKKILLSSLVCFSLYGGNLDELIDIALKNNTNIKQAKINVDTQKQALVKSKSLYLPTLSLEADRSNHDMETSGVKIDGNSQSVSLNASQLLYDFGKSTNKIEASQQNYEASKKEFDSSKASIILNVKKVYYDILNKQDLIDVAKESVKIDEFQLYQAQEYFKAKVKTKIDVTNAQLQLSNSKMSLLKANFDLKKAQAKLITLLSKDNVKISKEKTDINLLAQNVKNDNYELEKLIKIALENRDELKMYKHLQSALQSNYKASKSEFYPTVNLIGSYKDTSSNDIASLETEQTIAGIYLKWELFSGFRTEASKKEALNELKTINEKQKAQILSIKENVTNAYFDVEQNKQSIDIALLNIELSAQNMDLAQERYKNGLNSIVELNDAKLDFIKAKNDLVNQYYGYKISQAKLEYETATNLNNKKDI